MKVILIKDVPGLGGEGDTKDLANGYARNYLFPKGLAVPETAFARNRIKEQKKKIELQNVQQTDEAQKLADELSSISINIPAPAAHLSLISKSTGLPFSSNLAARASSAPTSTTVRAFGKK